MPKPDFRTAGVRGFSINKNDVVSDTKKAPLDPAPISNKNTTERDPVNEKEAQEPIIKQAEINETSPVANVSDTKDQTKKKKSATSTKGTSSSAKNKSNTKDSEENKKKQSRTEAPETHTSSRKKDIHIWIDPNMYKRLQIEAEYYNTSATDMICTAVERMLSGIDDHTAEIEKERKRKANRTY